MAIFKYEELIKSDIAVAHNIDNTPTPQHSDNLLQLLSILNMIGSNINYSIIVTSGYRTKQLNALVGGVDNSHHLYGYAADLTCIDLKGLINLIRNKYIQYIDQLIYYPNRNFIHLSIHPDNRQMYMEK